MSMRRPTGTPPVVLTVRGLFSIMLTLGIVSVGVSMEMVGGAPVFR